MSGARIARLLAASVLVGLATSAAAVELPFTGMLEFQVGSLPKVTVTGSGVAEVETNGADHITRIDMPASVFLAVRQIYPVTDPGAAPIKGVQIDGFGNQTGIFDRNGDSELTGEMPLRGTYKVCLFAPCSVALSNIVVPVTALGHEASTQVSAAVNLTVRGAPWTTGPIDASNGPVTGADEGLDLNLVTPVFVSTNIPPFAVLKPHARVSFSFGAVGDHCQNQLDDDGDGFSDYPADPGCASAEDASERTEGAPCDNGVDDDDDLRIDAVDPGCDGPTDASEHSPALTCDDELDGDGDGLIDMADPGCSGPADPSERGTLACDDGTDTDGDGFADLLDPGCASAFDDSERGPGLVCDDGIDTDLDGAIDFPADTGCASIQDPSERSAAFVCDNGVDDDGDGRSDYSVSSIVGDPGCSSASDPSEKSLALACDDNLDNDFDGRADVPQDPGCASPSDSSEQSSTLACDNGFDDDADGKIDSQQDAGCDAPEDPRESVDVTDGGVHVIDAIGSPGDGLYLDDHPFVGPSWLYLIGGGAIDGDLAVAGTSRVRVTGGEIEGSLLATQNADVEIEHGTIGGTIEARDDASITIYGTGFDLPLGAVGATIGSLTGFLLDGTPFVWDFVRDSTAEIILAPEPEASSLAVLAIGALVALRRRSMR